MQGPVPGEADGRCLSVAYNQPGNTDTPEVRS